MSDLKIIDEAKLLADIKKAEKARTELKSTFLKTIKLFNKELSKPKESHDDELIDLYAQQIDRANGLLFPKFTSKE
jgi:hypothetical protein